MTDRNSNNESLLTAAVVIIAVVTLNLTQTARAQQYDERKQQQTIPERASPDADQPRSGRSDAIQTPNPNEIPDPMAPPPQTSHQTRRSTTPAGANPPAVSGRYSDGDAIDYNRPRDPRAAPVTDPQQQPRGHRLDAFQGRATVALPPKPANETHLQIE